MLAKNEKGICLNLMLLIFFFFELWGEVLDRITYILPNLEPQHIILVVDKKINKYNIGFVPNGTGLLNFMLGHLLPQNM